MVTFTRAQLPATGDPITSPQMRSLARAFNDRLRSGIGDGAWRVVMYWFNLWRQVRNPSDGGFVFPSQAEFFELYQLLDPEHTTSTWPLAEAGEFEGANVANPMMQFVHGLAGSLDSEPARLNDPILPLWLGAGPPVSLQDFWTLGKLQRGGLDPLTGLQNLPAFEAAQSFFKISAPFYSPHGKSYGGYFPLPVELVADCGGGIPSDPGYRVPSYQIMFTGLRADAVTSGLHGTIGTDANGMPTVTYAGSCPQNSMYGGAGHVLYIARWPFAYYIWVDNGAGGTNIDRLPINDWIEGPYTGQGSLSHAEGGQLQRALNAFIKDFRGTPAQRTPDDFDLSKIAFDFEDFFTHQYYLAPARAALTGAELELLYPRAAAAQNKNDGDLLDFDAEQAPQHLITTDFSIAGFFASAAGLADAVALDILDGSTVVASLALQPSSSGAAESMHWLRTPITAGPLKVRVNGQLRFSNPAGVLALEAAELYSYKPELWDAYLLLRMAATKGGWPDDAGLDGSGLDASAAPSLLEN